MKMDAREWSFATKREADEEVILSLGFSLSAPGEREAREVAAVLRARSDYEPRVLRRKRGWLRKSEAWAVEASLPPTKLSLEALNRRTEWLDALARQHRGKLEERTTRWSASFS